MDNKSFDVINIVFQNDNKLPNMNSKTPMLGKYIIALVVVSFNMLVTRANKGNFTDVPFQTDRLSLSCYRA